MFCAARSQAREILRSIEDRLATIGSDKRQIAHITIWLADVSYFAEVTAVWNEWVDPAHPPVRACAQVGIPNKDLKVEMIVVAHAPPVCSLSSKPVRYATIPSGTGTKLAQPERSKLLIEQLTKFTLAINARTAKQLGISIPPGAAGGSG